MSDPIESDVSSSSSEGDDDQTFDDWVSDSDLKQRCQSLFDDKKFDSVEQVAQHDKSAHGFDLDEFCRKLGLDFHGRIRLINYIRKTGAKSDTMDHIELTNPIFTSDEYLIPFLEDDPLLRIQSSDAWEMSASDFEDEDELPVDPEKKIRILASKLKKTEEAYKEYRGFIQDKIDTLKVVAEIPNQDESSVIEAKRDDDTSYFESYAENDIHAVMINDKVRTATYADFISSSSNLFMNAIVLDVGCGTGILSLFAARAGAKRVISVDASPIADKASVIVSANDLTGVITVVKGKIEDLPDELVEGVKEVDVIISEWMGYGLLYESMLDSVLCARDRWLKKPDPSFVPGPSPITGAVGAGGVMAPSQCQMVLGLCDPEEIKKERIKFWDDVYGFNMSVMADEVYNDAVTDVVPPEALLSEPYVVKDLYLQTITPHSYTSFSSEFTLQSTASKRTKITAFILYFDTFFTSTGRLLNIEQNPTNTNGCTTTATTPSESKVRVRMISPGGNPVVAEVWPLGGTKRSLSRRREEQQQQQQHENGEGENGNNRKAELRAKRRSTMRDKEVIKSFSTSPQSEPTHWKQTLFFLRDPFAVTSDSVVRGKFYCKRSTTNSREMDVEIHYSVYPDGVEAENREMDVVVQMYKVR